MSVLWSIYDHIHGGFCHVVVGNVNHAPPGVEGGWMDVEGAEERNSNIRKERNRAMCEVLYDRTSHTVRS